MNSNPLQTYLKLEKEKTEAWIAEDPKHRGAGILCQDIEHWNKMDIFTVAQLERYLDQQCYVNLYKDAHGFKPSGVSMMTDEKLTKAIEGLSLEEEVEPPKKKKKLNRDSSLSIMAIALNKYLGKPDGKEKEKES